MKITITGARGGGKTLVLSLLKRVLKLVDIETSSITENEDGSESMELELSSEDKYALHDLSPRPN